MRAESAALAGPKEQPVWQAYQQWLALGECRVVIPYATALAEKIPPIAVRLRRDFATLLAVIRAHALIHRGTRAADGEGHIVATAADYAAVHGLVVERFAEGVEATVPPTVRSTVEAVKGMLGADKDGGQHEVAISALAKKLELRKSTVSDRVRRAIDRGFLVNKQEKKGLPARIALGDPLPDELQVLPPPEVLFGGCSGVRSDSGGVPLRAQIFRTPPPGESDEAGKKQMEAGEKPHQPGSGADTVRERCARKLTPSDFDRTPEHPPYTASDGNVPIDPAPALDGELTDTGKQQ